VIVRNLLATKEDIEAAGRIVADYAAGKPIAEHEYYKNKIRKKRQKNSSRGDEKEPSSFIDSM
jgi:hypothetical protein